MNDNVAVMRRLVDEAINGRDLSVIDDLVTSNFIYHDPTIGQVGADGLKAVIGEILVAFPDIVWTIDEQITEGDKVVSRFSWEGTHTADFGFVPATGMRVLLRGVSIDRFFDGQLAETRVCRDG